MEEVKRIILRAGQHLSKEETLSLRGTKALRIEQYSILGKNLPISVEEMKKGITSDSEYVTTWSAIVRNALDMLREAIRYVNSNINTADEFIGIFEISLNKICEEMNFKLNGNCPKRLYKEAEEDDLINSKVYKSNKNHLLKVITDEYGTNWYMCAVYTQEIVVMLEALLDTIYAMAEEFTNYRDKIDEFPQTVFVIEYIERENQTEDEEVVTETVEDIDEELQNLDMSKDLLRIQGLAAKLTSVSTELYTNIEIFQNKYGLKTLDDILGPTINK